MFFTFRCVREELCTSLSNTYFFSSFLCPSALRLIHTLLEHYCPEESFRNTALCDLICDCCAENVDVCLPCYACCATLTASLLNGKSLLAKTECDLSCIGCYMWRQGSCKVVNWMQHHFSWPCLEITNAGIMKGTCDCDCPYIYFYIKHKGFQSFDQILSPGSSTMALCYLFKRLIDGCCCLWDDNKGPALPLQKTLNLDPSLRCSSPALCITFSRMACSAQLVMVQRHTQLCGSRPRRHLFRDLNTISPSH